MFVKSFSTSTELENECRPRDQPNVTFTSITSLATTINYVQLDNINIALPEVVQLPETVRHPTIQDPS